jgi:hypothetical protein
MCGRSLFVMKRRLRLKKSDRAFVIEGIREHLARADPKQRSRNKFRLRRASPFAEFELRLDPWRVFYRLNEERVEVTMIGEKRGNVLWIAGEEFIL